MPNNFRLTGNIYVSNAGHDSNSGTTSDAPKKTIDGAISAITANGQTIIVGAGMYFQNISASTSYTGLTIKGDGYVIIAGNVTNRFAIINNIVFGFSQLTYTFTTGITANITDCIFSKFTLTTGNGSAYFTFTRCKFIECIDNQTIGLRLHNISSCIFISGSMASSNYPFKDNYVDPGTVHIHMSNLAQSSPAAFRNNNIRGLIRIGGLDYAIQDQFTGTPLDNGYGANVKWLTEANLTANGYTGTIVGWNAAVATCINRPPRFNDESKLDFTLKSDSPHIGRALNGVDNIGGTQYAQSFYVGGSNPNILLLQASSEIDTITNPTDWRLNSGQTQGVIRAIIKVSNTNEVISTIPYIGNYAFDSNSTPGSDKNFNVPDSKPMSNNYPNYLTTTGFASDAYRVVIANHGFSTGVWIKVDGQYREITSVTQDELIFLSALRGVIAGSIAIQVGTLTQLTSLNPNRLGFRMRSSKTDVVDVTNWDNPLTWDNDNLANAGDYLEQEWNRQPMIDNLNQVGFGDDNYNATYGSVVQVKYIDLEIYLRNDYKS